MWPFAGVHANVSFKQAGSVKYLSASVTGKHCFGSPGGGRGEFDGEVVVVVEVERGEGVP